METYKKKWLIPFAGTLIVIEFILGIMLLNQAESKHTAVEFLQRYYSVADADNNLYTVIRDCEPSVLTETEDKIFSDEYAALMTSAEYTSFVSDGRIIEPDEASSASHVLMTCSDIKLNKKKVSEQIGRCYDYTAVILCTNSRGESVELKLEGSIRMVKNDDVWVVDGFDPPRNIRQLILI